MDTFKVFVDGAGLVLQSQFSVALILLVIVFFTNRRLTRYQQNTEMHLMECEAAGVMDRSHRDTFKLIATEYRMLYIGAVSGKREASPELDKIDLRMAETRRAVHEDTKRRAQKLHASVEELKKHIEKDLL